MEWDTNLYQNKHDFVAEYGKGLLEFVPENPELKILDLGCGTGTLTEQLTIKSNYVIGVDGSPAMIKKAKEIYPQLKFKVLNALEMDYLEEWDIIFSNAVFHWIPNHKLLIQNIYRALKKDGMLICEFGGENNIKQIEDAFMRVVKMRGYEYHSPFLFPRTDDFGKILMSNTFEIIRLYDYNRPTPLKDGEKGLRNWMKQFFANDIGLFSDKEQNEIFTRIEEKLRDQMWDGVKWVADYRRLRAIVKK